MSSALRPARTDRDSDALVAHARFVRALAGRLLHDTGEADELAAGTRAEAIARRPESGPSLRPWLRRVVWRLLRRERRDGDGRPRGADGSAAADRRGVLDARGAIQERALPPLLPRRDADAHRAGV